MRRIAVSLALTIGLVATGIAPATAADTSNTGASAGETPATSASAVAPPPALPPPAPTPTSTAISPDAPDPHPPLGGIGPNGLPVGGEALLNRGTIVPPGAPALPSGITAEGWILVDLDQGTVLAARDPHGRYQPASILKTLTSVVLIPQLPGNQVVTVSPTAANAEGSAVGLVEGGTYTVDQLFGGLLLESGNDTAQALAEAAGGAQQTVAEMNAEARSLGAYDTYVQTPSGLDGWQQLTSAYDMALVLRAAVNMPRFVAYDREPTSLLPAQDVNGKHWDAVTVWNQGYQFFDDVPGALVEKIGYTDAALHTYVCATQRNGRRLGVVFLRAQRYPTDQWQQAATLLDWGYALPAGTQPIGALAGPVADRPSPTASSTTSAASEDAAPHGAVSSPKAVTPVAAGTSTSGGRYSVAGWIIAAALLVLAALITRRRFRR